MTPVDFFPRIPFLLANIMKLKQPAVMVSVTVLAMAGLYVGFLQPDSQTPSQTTTDRKSNATPANTSTVDDSAEISVSRHDKRTAVDDREAEDHGSTVAVVQRGAARPPLGTSSMQDLPDSRSTKDQRGGQSVDHAVDQETTAAAQPQIPVGIQLAPDVRLPVAAMPNDLNLNPIKQKVLQHIVDEYYRTVADATASAVGNGATVETKIEDNGEETRIITNSPAVDAARKQADQRFKAIFGDAAYIRMTMNTLLESRLLPNKLEK
jgi:hypothetical protein